MPVCPIEIVGFYRLPDLADQKGLAHCPPLARPYPGSAHLLPMDTLPVDQATPSRPALSRSGGCPYLVILPDQPFLILTLP